MKYIRLKIESDSLEIYNHRKQSIQNWKYFFIGIQVFIQLPLGVVVMAYSSNDDDLLKYYDLIFVCVIITRFFHLLLDTIIYNQFARLILYYLDKKKNLVRLRSISYDERKFTLSGFQRFVIFWVCFLFALKISTALIDLTWLTYFQLNRGRTEIDYLIQSIYERFYVTLVDFLIALTFLYFFYFQGTYQQRQANNLNTFYEQIRRGDTNSTAGFGDGSDMQIIIESDD